MQRSRREFIKLGAIGTALSCTPIWLPGADAQLFGLPAGPKKFLKACTEGQLDTVKQLLAADPDLLSAKDKVGRSGFALALLAGYKPVAEWLQQAGYESDLHEAALALDWERFSSLVGTEDAATPGRINAGHPVGGCAMWAAAAGGAGSDIWRVYSPGGDPNCTGDAAKGTTPLQKALRYSDLAIAEVTAASLLSNNADPALALGGDSPPLHIAAERGSYELAEMLVRLGADVQRTNKKGKTALQVAELAGHSKVWELLQQEQNIARTCRTSRHAYTADGQGYQVPDISALAYHLRGQVVGSAHGSLEVVKKALESDPRLAHSVATTSEKAVEASAHMGRKELADLLLQHGAPYSLPTAVMLGDYTTVKRLLDEDPQRIQERGAHDFALLWYPIIGKCEPDMMQLLLDRGAQVKAQHYLGTTALHWAGMRGPIELVELLVEKYPAIVSQEEIKAAIWPEVQVDFERSLHYCIRQIRAALNEDAAHPRFIETIPRRGYRWIAEIKPDAPLQQPANRPPIYTRKWALLSLLAFISLLAYVSLLGRKTAENPTTTQLRIAIMPFQPTDSSNTFAGNDLALRLVETLTNEYQDVYQIIGPSTTAHYAPDQLRQLIQDFGIDCVLNGRFSQVEDTSRLLAEIIRAEDGAHVWVKYFNSTVSRDSIVGKITEGFGQQFEPDLQ